MRTADEWLLDYSVSHRNPSNKVLHWLCVPIIIWCALGLAWTAPFPATLRVGPAANWAGVAALAVLVYYAFLSPRLALGMFPLVILIGPLWLLADFYRRAGIRY
jgi:uncharacterized membrane protein YGL010W